MATEMKLRRYCVTVMDNWMTTREFFTLRGALRWRSEFPAGKAHLFRWDGERWLKLEARDIILLLGPHL